LLIEALELMSLAATELIEHHDGLHEDELLLRLIESRDSRRGEAG
jgi:hypothetical protein